MKKTTKIFIKHYLIGILITTIGFWLVGEIPSWFSIKNDWIEWISTIVSIPFIVFFISKQIEKNNKHTNKRIYLFSALMMFLSWVLILYFKAFLIGIIDSIQSGEEKILESIVGFTIYQLWIFIGLGIINGLLGGIFLGNELKRNLKI